MKKLISTLLSVCCFVAVFAQTPITLPLLSPYSENFNTTPGASGTTYPAGWVAYNFATTLDDAMITGSSGSNTGANYNYGSCVGILGSGSNYLPGTIVLAIANTTGKKSFKISYNIKKIREQTRNNTFNLQVGTVSATGTFTDVTGGLYDSGSIPEGTSSAYTNIALPATLDNKSTAIFIRFYYSDIAGSGSRDGVALDDVVLSWSSLGPDINSPSVQNPGDASVRLGANVVADGGNAITQRGVVIGAGVDPTIGQPGVTQVNISGTTGVFDTLVNGLTPGTLYHFRAFATNSTGTSYTDDKTFYTLSAKPTAVAGLTANAISDHDIRLDWTASSNASGYLVLQKMYTAPTDFPVNATRYNEGAMLGDAEIVDTILDGNAITRTYSALVSGTIYQYAVVAYRFNGINAETYHYNTDAVVPVAFDTTWGVGPSATSDLVGITGSEAVTISSVSTGPLTTATSGTKVWQLALRDGGSTLTDADNMPTAITRMAITKGITNKVSNWQNILSAAALFDDSTGLKLADGTVYADSIVFGSLVFEAQDNNQRTATLRVSLKTSGIKDLDSFQFAIKKTFVRSPGLNQSSQIPAIDIRTDSVKNVVDVTATRFVITQQPAATIGVNAFLPQPVRVELRDSNNNIDTYNQGTYQLISAQAVLRFPRVELPVSGVLVFDSISFISLAKGNVLKIFGNAIDTAYTTPVNIFASTASSILAIPGFVYTDSISYVDYQSTNITLTNSVAVFGIKILDGGAGLNDPDNFGTTLSSITFTVGNFQYVRKLALFQAGVKVAEVPVASAGVTFGNLNVLCNDNDSLPLELRATFNSRYANAQRITFTVSNAVADTAKGSVFAVADAGGAASSSAGARNVLKYRTILVTPPVVLNATVCAGADHLLVASKQAGHQVKWYAVNDTLQPVHAGDSLLLNNLNTSVSYYAATDSSGWPSAKVLVSISAIQIATPVLAAQTVCRGNAASLNATSGYAVKWYRSIVGNEVIVSGNTFNTGIINNDTVFYLQADSGGCFSARKAVAVTITRVVAPVVKDTTICKGQPVALSAAGANAINWFASATSTAPVATGNGFAAGTVNADTTFYVQSDSVGCRSERKLLRVSVRTIAAPVFITDTVVICEGAQATLVATNTVNWYATQGTTSPLITNDTLVTGALTANKSYYANRTEGGCSSDQSMIIVKVNPKPVAPVVAADSVCMGTSARLSATGSNALLTWYDAANGGTLLHTGNNFNTPVLNTNTTYYVNAEANGCTINRVQVDLKIKARPVAPGVTANVIACSGAPVKLGASAASGIVKWFAGLTDSVSIGSDSLLTPALTEDIKYYAATEQNACLSTRQTINVKVNKTPVADFTVNAAEQCLSNNQFTFLNAANNPAATQYAWSFGDSTSFTFANPVKTFRKKGTYTVTLKTLNNGCSSSFSKEIKVNAPDVDFTFGVVGSTVTFTPVATNIVAYKWVFTATDSSDLQSPEHVFAGNGTYLVTLVVTDREGCSSAISKPVVITATGLADVLAASYRLSVYPNPAKENANVVYTLTAETHAKIEVLDMRGRLVKTIINERQPRGDQQVRIDTGEYPKGLYFIKVELNGAYKTMKLQVQ